jgi:hypothetical protein
MEKKLNLTPEMIEDIKNAKGFDYEKHDADVEIEKIAWQVFQTKLGITWRRILTAEEKLSITEKEEYQQYRDIAVGVWEKKQKALLNKKYPVIEVPADGSSGMWGGAYVLCFVYSKHDGNFVLTGYMREVEAYLKKNHTHYFCNMSMWWNGVHRDVWHFWKDSVGIHTPHRDSKSYKGRDRWKWQVRPYVDWSERTEENVKEADEKALWFKRMPKRWIPEFDAL